MLKNLSIPSLKKVASVICRIAPIGILSLIVCFLLFDTLSDIQKRNNGRVGISRSMQFGNFVLNINEERSLTGEKHLTRMLSLRGALQTVNNKAFLDDGIVLSRDILLESTSPGNYRVKILLNTFTRETTEDVKNRYLNALKKFYKAYDLEISWVPGIAG